MRGGGRDGSGEGSCFSSACALLTSLLVDYSSVPADGVRALADPVAGACRCGFAVYA